LAALLTMPSPAAAQAQPAAPTPTPQGDNPPAAPGEAGTKSTRSFFPALIHNLGDDLRHIPRRNSAYWLVAGVGLAVAVHPVDSDINAHLRNRSTNPFGAGKFIGLTPTILGAGAATYLYGRFTDSPRARHIGMDEIEATILAEAIVQGAKRVIRRDRPLLDDGTRQKGFSMPSGHATVTFAAATVLQQHLGYKWAVPTYVVASYVALSRLRDNRHFASDVAMGAATGIIIGRSVTWHGRNFYATPQFLPGGGGILVASR
jgi:membrane-associated phospholipid phosphatase